MCLGQSAGVRRSPKLQISPCNLIDRCVRCVNVLCPTDISGVSTFSTHYCWSRSSLRFFPYARSMQALPSLPRANKSCDASSQWSSMLDGIHINNPCEKNFTSGHSTSISKACIAKPCQWAVGWGQQLNIYHGSWSLCWRSDPEENLTLRSFISVQHDQSNYYCEFPPCAPFFLRRLDYRSFRHGVLVNEIVKALSRWRAQPFSILVEIDIPPTSLRQVPSSVRVKESRIGDLGWRRAARCSCNLFSFPFPI